MKESSDFPNKDPFVPNILLRGTGHVAGGTSSTIEGNQLGWKTGHLCLSSLSLKYAEYI